MTLSFETLGLIPELLEVLKKKGYEVPTPIQEQAIPAVLAGKDLVATAQTGTGKTAGFTLPILQQLAGTEKEHKHRKLRCLILTPTRELAMQVHDSVVAYKKELRMFSAVVYGGVSINSQKNQLRRGVDILVATPGRLLDLLERNATTLNHIEHFVLDEADRMLDMGFIPDVRRILSKMKKGRRQNLLFSATISKEIRSLIKEFIEDPVRIDISPDHSVAETVEQKVIIVDREKKVECLVHLLQTNDWNQVLIFARTRHGTDNLAKKLNNAGIETAAIHGDKSQHVRTKTLKRFKEKGIRVLIATDIAARGLDINTLPLVVNYELPNIAEDYIHRIGRTGRAGNAGLAIALVAKQERKFLSTIEKFLKIKFDTQLIDGFKPGQRHVKRSKKIDAPPKVQDSRRNKSKASPQRTAAPKEGKRKDAPPAEEYAQGKRRDLTSAKFRGKSKSKRAENPAKRKPLPKPKSKTKPSSHRKGKKPTGN